MVGCIIVEDEVDAQNLLSKILAEYCPDLTLLGISSEIESAKELISLTKPQLLFLDIQLQTGTSFQLLDEIDHNKYKIIFTTAYEEYALKSYKYETIDYILKPYSPTDVMTAVNKVKRQLINLEDKIATENLTISLSTHKGLSVITISDIIRLEAERSYCTLYLASSKQSILISKPLKEIESLLPDTIFFRPHTSHLININYVHEFSTVKGGVAILTDKTIVPVSRRRKQEFLSKLSS